MIISFFLVYLFNLSEGKRERQHTSRGGAEREEARGSQAGSVSLAQSPTQGSNAGTVRL